MTSIKIALFIAFSTLLSATAFAQSCTGAQQPTASRGPDLVMQQDCPDGKVWSDEKQTCVPERPRGSY